MDEAASKGACWSPGNSVCAGMQCQGQFQKDQLLVKLCSISEEFFSMLVMPEALISKSRVQKPHETAATQLLRIDIMILKMCCPRQVGQTGWTSDRRRGGLIICGLLGARRLVICICLHG